MASASRPSDDDVSAWRLVGEAPTAGSDADRGSEEPRERDPSTAHVKVVAILVARRGKLDELRALLSSMVIASRAEPGNLRYDLWVDRDAPERFVLDELYIDAAANAAHRTTRHFQDYLSTIDGLAGRDALVLGAADVAR